MSEFQRLVDLQNAAIKEYESVKLAFQAKMKAEFEPIFQEFFKAFPEIKMIAWTQYTPYFNDGEACVFDIKDFEFILDMDSALVRDDIKKLYERIADEHDGNYGYGEADVRPVFRTLSGKHHYDEEQRKSLGLKRRQLTDAEKKLAQDCDELEDVCFKIKDLLSVALGDHVMVTATSKGFDVSEFDHD